MRYFRPYASLTRQDLITKIARWSTTIALEGPEAISGSQWNCMRMVDRELTHRACASRDYETEYRQYFLRSLLAQKPATIGA